MRYLFVLLCCSLCCADSFSGFLTVDIGDFRFFKLENEQYSNWRYLLSQREITITQRETDYQFEVYIGSSLHAVTAHFSPNPPTFDPLFSVPCGSKSMQSCSFSLSYYGYHKEWWIPHIEYFWETPPQTYVVVSVPKPYLQIGSDSVQFDISEYPDPTHTTRAITYMCIGIFIICLSPYLSKNLYFYNIMFFVLGMVLSLLLLFAILVYMVASFSPKVASLSGLIAIIIAVGWGSFYSTYLMDVFSFFQLKYGVVFAMFVGICSLLYFYKEKLTERETKQIRFFLRIFGTAFIFMSISQLETAVVGSIIIVAILSWLSSIIETWLKLKAYLEEGAVETASSLKQLAEHYREHPQDIKKLNPTTQERVIAYVKEVSRIKKNQ